VSPVAQTQYRSEPRLFSGGPPVAPARQDLDPQFSAAVSPAAPVQQGWGHTPPLAFPGAPSVEPPPAAASPSWWRRKAVIVSAVVALVAIVGGVAAVMVTTKRSDDSAQTASQENPAPSEAERPKGPIDGLFDGEFAALTDTSGTPYENAPGGTETWVFESSCDGNSCVATASKNSGSQVKTSTLVFDEVASKNWLAVAVTSGTCKDQKTDYWNVLTLDQQTDGRLVGSYLVRSMNGECASRQEVTFTRSGDVPAGSSNADPQAQEERTITPGMALWGKYRLATDYSTGGHTDEEYGISSYCVRTGQRCQSIWSSDGQMVFEYADDKWVRMDTSFDGTCKSGGNRHVEVREEYVQPAPPMDPVVKLTGQGNLTTTGDCPVNSDFTATLERISD
jgi:serine/threonine-protein kinase